MLLTIKTHKEDDGMVEATIVLCHGVTGIYHNSASIVTYFIY